MGTTSKMLIPYPEATGLVKDGWEDMKDIANQVDAKSGLVLLNTTSFSAVASQSINNVFTSAFKNYRIVLNAKNASATDLTFRVRAAGTDLTGSSYLQGRYYAGLQAAIAAGNNGNVTQTNWDFNQVGTVTGHVVMDIANPQATEVTTALTFAAGSYFQVLGQSLLTSNTTSYDGFTISTSSTMTGSVSVYGYNA